MGQYIAPTLHVSVRIRGCHFKETVPVGTSHNLHNHVVSVGQSTFCNGVEALEAALDHTVVLQQP